MAQLTHSDNSLGSLQKQNPNANPITPLPLPLGDNNQIKLLMDSILPCGPQAHWQNLGLQSLSKECQGGDQSYFYRDDAPQGGSYHREHPSFWSH